MTGIIFRIWIRNSSSLWEFEPSHMPILPTCSVSPSTPSPGMPSGGRESDSDSPAEALCDEMISTFAKGVSRLKQ